MVTALGGLARRSIWVGDRKQAIFGFQGSDPELMTAALDTVLGGGSPEILATSYRSRAQLVEFTSELFAGAFAGQAIPRDQVVLQPERPEEPAALAAQPPFALWSWTGGRAKEGEPPRSEAQAMAEAVEALLARRPELRVRERLADGGERLRPVTRRDVAVLAYRNDRCSAIATALRARGIAARVAASGLSTTPEGRLARAAVALMADPRDGVAALEVSWLSGPAAADPDGWLSGLLETTRAWKTARGEAEARGEVAPERPLPFAEEPRVNALREAAGQAGALSPSEAFDLALRAGRLGEVVRGWPDPGQALANLEALRAVARAYEDQCRSRRVASTVLGLVAHLGVLGEDPEADRQAMPSADDAVTVSTWHRSKGLEWPVVILAELDHERDQSAFQVTTVPAAGFRFEAPLAGRWVRYWPWPYGKVSKDAALADLAAQSPEGLDATARDARERLRLLYVIFTRARDLLGMVVERKKEGPRVAALAPLLELAALKPRFPFDARAGLDEVRLGERRWGCTVGTLEAIAPEGPGAPEAAAPWYAASPAAPRPREIVNPSAEPLPVSARVASVTPLAGRAPLAAASDMRAVGDALHAFLAADDGGPPAQRRAMAERLLAGFDVTGALPPEALLGAADALRRWAEARFPGATWHREWPLRARLVGEPPRLLVGEADLVLELTDGFVLVDHKSFPGGPEERDRRLVEEYAPQLAWYARVLAQALGKPLRGTFIHLPVRGEVAEVVLGT
ncbi:MAG: 3'-5' exonuclease [Anaeromyxobacter sp.]